jgi:hypothetical protein
LHVAVSVPPSPHAYGHDTGPGQGSPDRGALLGHVGALASPHPSFAFDHAPDVHTTDAPHSDPYVHFSAST